MFLILVACSIESVVQHVCPVFVSCVFSNKDFLLQVCLNNETRMFTCVCTTLFERTHFIRLILDKFN